MSRPRRRRAPVLVAGALASALLLNACGDPAPTGEDVPGVRPGVTLPAPGDRAPAPVTEEVPRLDDEGALALEEFAGQVVVVNFWASWCGPCREEQPELNAAAEAFAADPVQFVGVNIDDTVPNARAHEREFAIPYPSVFDPSAAYAAEFGAVGPRSIPTTILVDPEGRVAARLFGITDVLEVTALTERLLDEVP